LSSAGRCLGAQWTCYGTGSDDTRLIFDTLIADRPLKAARKQAIDRPGSCYPSHPSKLHGAMVLGEVLQPNGLCTHPKRFEVPKGYPDDEVYGRNISRGAGRDSGLIVFRHHDDALQFPVIL
jgi:hypothetical protein